MWAQAPKKAYLVGQIDVSNPTQYAEYAKLTPAIIEKFGGRFLARGGKNVTLEGRQAPGRVVVLEFPSFDRAQEFYDSPEYQKARKVREGAAIAQFVIFEGL
ncbi:MAG: DUF1330 domain-containing protein [Acidimicrobiia bacterium]